jgi:hypothetical protein
VIGMRDKRETIWRALGLRGRGCLDVNTMYVYLSASRKFLCETILPLYDQTLFHSLTQSVLQKTQKLKLGSEPTYSRSRDRTPNPIVGCIRA